MDSVLLEQRKEMLTALMKDPAYVPMKLKELAMLLNIPKSQREELKEVLDELLLEGRVGISRKGKYGKPDLFAVAGVYTGHPRGFGFVTVEGRDEDVFIPEEKAGSALNGDTVQIVIEETGGKRRAEGTVIKVLERANHQIIGTYQKSKSYGFVLPDNQKISRDIFIPQGKDMGAVSGHKVVVSMTDFGNGKKNPEGIVTEILGHVNDPGVDILSIVRAYNLPEEFPPEVMEECESVPTEVPAADKEGRKDLRGLPTVTIDGEDAKDLDDAVTLEKEGGVYRLGVHIADVTHYVKEGSPLDMEALKRGTSVYLVDRVIPMLPHRLSNGICSLNEGEDRLALSCLMEIDENGNLLGHEIVETLICVDRRMRYTAVAGILDGDEALAARYAELVARAKEAEKILSTFPQEKLDDICSSVADACMEHAERLAKMAVQETGFGRWEDKVLKNTLGSRITWESVRDLKTVGLLREDKEKGICEIGVPMGVVAALIPSTNPTSTAMYKSIISIKAGNAIIISPHPGAKNCITETYKVIREAAECAGGRGGLCQPDDDGSDGYAFKASRRQHHPCHRGRGHGSCRIFLRQSGIGSRAGKRAFLYRAYGRYNIGSPAYYGLKNI